MGDTVPYLFFFSYARSDRDAYLLRFFEDLKQRVALLEGIHDADTVGFRDEEGVITADDWSSKISAVLQISKVLVCIYTPRFFADDTCAKQFAAFLKRSPHTRYEPTPDPDGNLKYQVKEARNILPVLWLSEQDLLKKLPHVLRSIDYAIHMKGHRRASQIAAEYLRKGMRGISRRWSSVTRHDIIDHFARLIISAEALPSLDSPPTYHELWNAFWDDPPGYAPLGSAHPTLSFPLRNRQGWR